MIGAVVAQHLAPPGEDRVRLLAVDHHPIVPDRELVEHGIELPLEVGGLEVQVALDRIHELGRVGQPDRVALGVGHRVLEGHREGEPLQGAPLGARAALLDEVVQVERRAVLALPRPVGHGDLDQQVLVLEQVLQLLALAAALGRERREPCGGAVQEDLIGGQVPIQPRAVQDAVEPEAVEGLLQVTLRGR